MAGKEHEPALHSFPFVVTIPDWNILLSLGQQDPLEKELGPPFCV